MIAKRNRLTASALLAVSVLLLTLTAGAGAHDREIVVNPHAADQFARLPGDLRFPEGITANPANGDIYVGTFDGGVANALLHYNRHGRLIARTDFPSITPLLGLAFNPQDRKVYAASVDDFTVGGSRIRRIAADFNSATPVEDVGTIPNIGAPPARVVPNPDGSSDTITFGQVARVPNGLIFNSDGDLFVSDSFQGAVFRFNQAHACGGAGPVCTIDTVAHSGLLATAGFPPFGANGITLNPAQTQLYIANTGDERILRLNLGSDVIDVFAESLNGADGIAFDHAGNLWVAENQADRVTALDENGRVVAQLGAFLGLRRDGSARGLLFPASIVILGKSIFVTNLALPLTGIEGQEPEADVTRYTVSRIRIPGELRE